MSLTIRVDGKPVEKEIHFDKDGWLTESSRKALINHLRNEISNNSRMVHNHDHTVNNAKCQWSYNPNNSNISGYGMGPTRQTILIDKAELYHSDLKSSQHWYIPSIEKHQGLYIYQIYPGETPATRTSIDNGKAPILIWGKLIPRDLEYNDRLHLKLILPKESDKFIEKVDPLTITRKYDGASTYFNSDGTGFKFFSPRISKVTEHRIEYTYKLPELSETGHASEPVGMGELMFWKYTKPFEFLKWLNIRGPEWITWKYLSAAEIGGILNADKIRPRNVWPEIRVYRIDIWKHKNVIELPFFENRELQEELIKPLNHDYWKLVEFAMPGETFGWEGLVGTSKNDSIINGYKIKWWNEDLNDWEIISVDLGISEKGNIMGVVWFKSLDSNKTFKLGPNQIGSFDDCIDIINNKEKYIGRVAKIASRRGHEARAAKLVEYHLDKGIG